MLMSLIFCHVVRKKKYKVAVLKIGALPKHLLNNSNVQLIDCKKYMVKF